MDEKEKMRVRNEIVIERLNKEDFADISGLIGAMDGFGATELRLRDKSAAYYQWMYLANPVGPAVVVGAKHRGRLVSSFAIAPKLMQLPDGERIVGKTMDMFTHPEYQGLGLMSKVAGAAFDAAAEEGMGALFVTPSSSSYPIFKKKYRYREDFEVVYRAHILRPGRLVAWKLPAAGKLVGRFLDRAWDAASRLLSRRLPKDYSMVLDTSFGEVEEVLWRRVAVDYGVATVRSAEYLNWRYVDHVDNYTVIKLYAQRQLVGFIVLKKTLRRGMSVGEIVDYICIRGDTRTFNLLVHCALEHFRSRSVVICEAWVIPSSRQEREFIRAGLWYRRATIKFLLDPNFPSPVENDTWLLTQGDGNDV